MNDNVIDNYVVAEVWERPMGKLRGEIVYVLNDKDIRELQASGEW